MTLKDRPPVVGMAAEMAELPIGAENMVKFVPSTPDPLVKK